jgi:hypothetical protein
MLRLAPSRCVIREKILERPEGARSTYSTMHARVDFPAPWHKQQRQAIKYWQAGEAVTAMWRLR